MRPLYLKQVLERPLLDWLEETIRASFGEGNRKA